MSNTIGHPRGTTVEKFKATFKFQRLNYVPMTKSRENGSNKTIVHNCKSSTLERLTDFTDKV